MIFCEYGTFEFPRLALIANIMHQRPTYIQVTENKNFQITVKIHFWFRIWFCIWFLLGYMNVWMEKDAVVIKSNRTLCITLSSCRHKLYARPFSECRVTFKNFYFYKNLSNLICFIFQIFLNFKDNLLWLFKNDCL